LHAFAIARRVAARRDRFHERIPKTCRLGLTAAWTGGRGAPLVYTPPMRRIAPLVVLALTLACAPRRSDVRDAASQGRRYFGDFTPPAGDVFTFNNGAEPETIDPGTLAGQPDGRVARILFEGLTTPDPRTMEPRPGLAYRWEISPDGLTYTFHLRPGLLWSDGSPLTARDFLWSWTRVLKPETAARNAGLLFPIANAQVFNQGRLTDETKLGLAATDDSTFVVRLGSPTPYFLFLTQYTTFLPVPRRAIERYGNRWTSLGNLVGNGPFLLARWRQGDRFEFTRNPLYWDARSVRLDRVVALSVEDVNTCTNLYKAGVVDWNPSGYLPSQFIPYMRAFGDFRDHPYQGVYFFSINVTRKPFDDPWVRRALAYALDREAIARDLLKGARDPSGNFTPLGYPGYVSPPGQAYDPERARACLAKAGYPGGRDFPRFSILFNTSEDNRRIAEAVQSMWKRTLGIDVQLANEEWGSYLQDASSLHYDVARRSWIGDYLDPNSFLACFRSSDGNNRTGFADRRYDALLDQAAVELDPARRMTLLARAESELLGQAPLIPVYRYRTSELLKPYVRGLYPTPLDTHPLKYVWIDHEGSRSPVVARR
jgi:oligopeptide transport system substrate-binding protein